MARTHARFYTTIWRDADFRRLPGSAQRMYFFLASQPNLTHAGVLPLTLARWAACSVDGSEQELLADLELLHERRFVVLDRATEEVMIRTFVVGDKVYKMPRVMGSMVASAQQIESPVLRRTLLDEVARIPLDELSTEPTKKAPHLSIRVQVEGLIAELRESFGEPVASAGVVDGVPPMDPEPPGVDAPVLDAALDLRYPIAPSVAGVPDWLAPLAGAMAQAGIGVPWSFKEGDSELLRADVERVGLRAMFTEAVEAFAAAGDKPFSSRWFYPRWHALQVASVVQMGSRRSNSRQAQTDDQYEQSRRDAEERRAARLAAEAGARARGGG
ncbi:hypothetical protein B4N89_27405 [Embleya scabrispora]|uniref:Uncharacterized protein n=1 Tax=Embleya scabrispora TaxID=159449 RepID=A0A1T3P4Z9_9ACTN|nr:hypothetical protein [Embleya scabrispora]OPC84156.1 hypothetical protein B4N89_27405 [Embleya scabrispora]